MKTAKKLYPGGSRDSSFNYESSYTPMLEQFGTILLKVDDKDWQGDSRILYEKDNLYGYLQFGWGSCTGCDALQSCTNIKEIQELMDRLCNSVKWFDSAKEALKFFIEHDWQGDYSYHQEEQKEFIEKAKEILGDINE